MPLDQARTSWYWSVTWIALILVISLAITDAVLAPASAPSRQSFIEVILASRAVVAAIRIAVIFAATFVVLSVIALIARRQWLTRVGPVEVEKVSNLDAEVRRLEEELEAANQIIEDLEGNAAYTQQLVDSR